MKLKSLLLSISIIFIFVINSYSQDKKEIIVTREIEETEGYVKGEEIYATHHKVYGKANTIRVKAIEKLKTEAASKGYDLVLITKDDFSNTPINNVSLVAYGYTKKKD